MNAIMVQYFLGLYFTISAFTLPGDGKITADLFRLVAGLILVITAIFGLSPIK